jgi:transcriptional regulator with XRE-family HTH domain
MNSDPSDTNPAEITLKTLREGRGMTQGELGSKLGLSYRAIAEWESGRKLPRFDNAVALARELSVSLKVLAKAMQINVEGVPDDSLQERWPTEGDD